MVKRRVGALPAWRVLRAAAHARRAGAPLPSVRGDVVACLVKHCKYKVFILGGARARGR
ncbi:hypothetical protein DA2_1084 [Desulfovibrio sp. A2]|nr:hypothetical protein DA2_1084 [Desulfovibrio sp. A2]